MAIPSIPAGGGGIPAKMPAAGGQQGGGFDLSQMLGNQSQGSSGSKSSAPNLSSSQPEESVLDKNLKEIAQGEDRTSGWLFGDANEAAEDVTG